MDNASPSRAVTCRLRVRWLRVPACTGEVAKAQTPRSEIKKKSRFIALLER